MRTTEDREYSWSQLLAEGFPADDYAWPDFAGTFGGTLDAKCWGTRRLRGSLVASITLDDGRKIKCIGWKGHRYAWQAESWVEYKGLREIGVGQRVELELGIAKGSGRAYLESITAIP